MIDVHKSTIRESKIVEFEILDDYKKKHYSTEIDLMTRAFLSQGYNIYWTCEQWLLHNKNIIKVYEVATDREVVISLKEINNFFVSIILRKVGSIEKLFDKLILFFEMIGVHFNKTIINAPDTIVYGMTKQYMIELEKIGFPCIPTRLFERDVSLKTILSSIENPSKYLIKSNSGELGNNVFELNKVTENMLREKQNVVKGWLVQPIIEDIWYGEFQILFFGNDAVLGIKKEYYNQSGSKIPDQNFRKISFFQPTFEQVLLGRKIKKVWEAEFSLKLDVFRLDLLKHKKGKYLILEVETANPGFWVEFMPKTDATLLYLKLLNLITNERFCS